MDSFHYEQLNENNVETAKKMCDTHLGNGFYTVDFLKSLIDKPNHFFQLVFVENRCVAICYCYLSNSNELLAIHPDWIIEKNKTIGIFKTIGIEKDYRHTGLSDQLTQWCKDMLTQAGAHDFYCLAWKKIDYVPAHRHLTQAGFTVLQNVEKPWYYIKSCYCELCNSSPCVCNGVLYTMREEIS